MIKTILSSPTAEILLIFPPAPVLNRTSLGLHLLQACARQTGYEAKVFYGNMSFANLVGLTPYNQLTFARYDLMPAERLFAHLAYEGMPLLGYNGEEFLRNHTLPDDLPAREDPIWQDRTVIKVKSSTFKQMAIKAQDWVEEIATTVAALPYKVVGSSTMFDQTAPSVALLRRIKELRPDIITLIGGPNCDGGMAEGIASLSDSIDHVFAGESEVVFTDFLEKLKEKTRPQNKIVRGQPLDDMESLPLVEYSDFFSQFKQFLPDYNEQKELMIVYESSRGCWWGEKHHCTFCGLNGDGMGYRAKSSQKVVGEIRELLANNPEPKRPINIMMADNIMPYAFFNSTIPELSEVAEANKNVSIFYEQKANLSLDQVMALVKAGVTRVQPGIEALSSDLLKCMDKGVTAAQNIALLRYARSTGMTLRWTLLRGFPGDKLAWYEETLRLIPLLTHLEPPSSFVPLTIDRFCPYYVRPEKYGITNVTPWEVYKHIFPSHVDHNDIAYHFTGDFEADSTSNPELVEEIETKVKEWNASWRVIVTGALGRRYKKLPVLHVSENVDGTFLLKDSRGLPGTSEEAVLTYGQAMAALAPRSYSATAETEWAIENKLAVVVDEYYYVPLATAAPLLLKKFETESRERFSRRAMAFGNADVSVPLVMVN